MFSDDNRNICIAEMLNTFFEFPNWIVDEIVQLCLEAMLMYLIYRVTQENVPQL